MGLTTGNSVVLTGLAIELDIANPKSYAVFGGAKGYSLGGQSSTTNFTTAEKITYSNDTTAAQTTANLSVAKQSATGCSEGNTKGFTLGGYVAGSSAYTTTTEKTFYSSDVTATATSANSSIARGYQCSVSTYNNKGYICGGFTGAGVPITTVDFLYFANEVAASQTTAALTAARAGVSSLSLPNVKGYVLGGSSGGGTVFFSTAEKITYSTDALAAQTSANLSLARSTAAGLSECSTKGYIAGGSTASPGAVGSTTDKLTFSTDTTAAQTTANLSSARSDMAYPSQGSSKGYFMGGFTNASSCIGVVTSDKITFTTDTTAAQSSANISVARGLASSLDNIYSQNISDIAGGVNNATINNFTTYSRENGGCLIFNGSIDYPNTATITANSSYAFGTGDFTYEVWFNAASFASGNNYILDLGSNAGNLQYYAGKLSYYNSTIGVNANLATKGPSLIPNNWYHAVITRVSGTTYMYINGNLITSNSDSHNYSAPAVTLGNYGGGGKYSWNGKIALFRLYSGKGLSATEVLQNYNATKNRFLVPNPIIDSNLLLNLDASNRLSFARYGGSKGYICGGYTGANVVTSDKLTYSTDTTVASTVSNLSLARSGILGISEGSTKGFICGGISSVAVATTDKITYSTDATAAQTSSNLVYERYGFAAFSDNTTKGYSIGGNKETNSAYNSGQRIFFSTEAFSYVVPLNFPTAKLDAYAISDGKTKAIIAGGTTAGYTYTALVTTCDKVTFATETNNSISATLSTPRAVGCSMTDFQAKAYFVAGYQYSNSTGSLLSASDVLSFATDSISASSTTTLNTARWQNTGLNQVNANGYALGGYTNTAGTGYASTSEKLSYITGLFTNTSSANLSQNRAGLASAGPVFDTSNISTWYDTTSNNNTSTLTNGPTYDLVQPAVIFDGTNDYGSFNQTGLLNPGNNLTIEGFVRFLNLTQPVACIFNANDVVFGSQAKGYRLYYRYSASSEYGMGACSIRFQFGMTSAWAWNVYASDANTIKDTGWHHVALTASNLNTNSPTINFYLDGVKLTSTFWNASTKTAISYATDVNALRIGSTYFPSYPAYEENYLNGNISNLKVFNRSLSDLEVLQDYQYYVNRLAFSTVGTSKDFPAPSGVAIKSVNPYAQTGWYWLSVGGTTSQFWIDMEYDGGGWVMVINNRAGNGAMPNVTYVNATTQNINSTGNYGTSAGDYTPSSFNLWVGLNAWKTIADASAGSNTVVMFVSTAYKTLADINNHTKRARFTWTGWSATYAWQGAASYVNEKGSTTAGLWAYHITNGYSLTTYDVDQDVYGANCSTIYGNSPWWFGACWDGFYFPNGGGYADYVNWAGAGTDLHNYGAIYVR